jgi:hypothetical protein
MQPKIYNYLDVDAPVLDDAPGSLIALLEACLVTGYGDHEPAGWTKPFADPSTNSAVFRAPPGEGRLAHFLRINDSGATANVEGFMSMSEVSSGGGPFTTTGGVGAYWGKSTGGARQWLLAANDKCFWFFSPRGDYVNQHLMPMGFGELAHRYPGDLRASYLVGATTAATAVAIDTAYTVNSGEIAISGNPVAYMPGTMSAVAPGEYVGTFDGFLPGTLAADVTSTDLKLDYVWTSRIVMRNGVNGGSLSATHGVTTSPRGYIPGLLVPCLPLDNARFPFWTDLGGGRYVIPVRPGRANVLDTGDWEY